MRLSATAALDGWPPARASGRTEPGLQADSPAAQGLTCGFSRAIAARTDGETRRRVKVIGRLPVETSCLALVWAVLDRAARGWRGFTMTADGLRLL
jgi:hypothetical protein